MAGRLTALAPELPAFGLRRTTRAGRPRAFESGVDNALSNPFGINTIGHGFQLRDPVVQFDTIAGRGPAIISHAHSDHTAEDKRMPVFATPATADLLRARGHVGEIVRMPYDEWREFPGWRVKLLPAGHILGSAQILVERADGLRLLYTGDIKTRRGRTAEPARFDVADDLIMECTFGLPMFRFPDEEEVAARMVAFARECLERDEIPVFLGYSLGKGQEIMSILAEAGIPMLIHQSMLQITDVYRRHGYDFGDVERLSAIRYRQKRAWVIPPHMRPHVADPLPNARICYVSGWALIESRRESIGATLMAPLSDHADYYDLFDIVSAVTPRRVWTIHGPNTDLFALDVARRFDVQAHALANYLLDEDEA